MGGFGSTRPRRATWAGVCLAERLPFVKFTHQLYKRSLRCFVLCLAPSQMPLNETCNFCAGIHATLLSATPHTAPGDVDHHLRTRH